MTGQMLIENTDTSRSFAFFRAEPRQRTSQEMHAEAERLRKSAEGDELLAKGFGAAALFDLEPATKTGLAITAGIMVVSAHLQKQRADAMEAAAKEAERKEKERAAEQQRIAEQQRLDLEKQKQLQDNLNESYRDYRQKVDNGEIRYKDPPTKEQMDWAGGLA